MTLSDEYVLISALIYGLIITCFSVYSLITKKDLDEGETFLYVASIFISPILGMFISVLIFPAIVVGILWLISYAIYSLKNKQK